MPEPNLSTQEPPSVPWGLVHIPWHACCRHQKFLEPELLATSPRLKGWYTPASFHSTAGLKSHCVFIHQKADLKQAQDLELQSISSLKLSNNLFMLFSEESFSKQTWMSVWSPAKSSSNTKEPITLYTLLCLKFCYRGVPFTSNRVDIKCSQGL